MLLHDLLLPFLGALTGLLLGTLGAGGSVLALPAFVYGAGLPVKPSVAASLVVVGSISLLGALRAKRRCRTHGCPGQEVDGQVTALMTVGGLVGAFAGSRLAVRLPAEVQMLLFGLTVLTAAMGMLRRPKNPEPLSAPLMTVARSPALLNLLVLPLGAAVGMLTGLVGVGGGFLIVPALTVLARASIKRAAAMSLWIIAANSAAGLLGCLHKVSIAWSAADVFLAAAVLGLFAGQRLAAVTRSQILQRIFAAVLVIIGIFTIIKTDIRSHHAGANAPLRPPVQGHYSRKMS